MIYTSGTTGTPKGVMVKHENLVNYVTWFSRTAGLTGEDKTLLTSSFAFDLGYTSLYPSILKGGQIHFLPKETYMLPEAVLDYIYVRRITYLKMTPSLFSPIVQNSYFSAKTCRFLRLLVLGGEPIDVLDVEKAFRTCSHLQVMNHYGPTEVTIGCIAQFIHTHSLEAFKARPTIGKPIWNTNVFILDKYLNLLPIRIAGELYLSGAGVAKGYFKRESLTAEKFIELEAARWFASLPPAPAPVYGKAYRTGDLGRWLPDGHIEFLGRIDQQVKIRGFRIELGEIESLLQEHPQIKECVVLLTLDQGGDKDKYICAYIVPVRGLRVSRLREYLSRRLPAYMLPSYFVQVEKIPLTPNGKVDRKSLPQPGITAGPAYAAPHDKIEERLVKIWSGVLSGGEAIHPSASPPQPIGIDDNFFELGGHSLKATILISKIHEAFNIKIPLGEIFKKSTIRELAAVISTSKKEDFIELEKVEEKEWYELSSVQERLYFLQQMDKDSTAYNIPSTWRIKGNVDKTGIEKTFKKLIQRHESFKTRVVEIEEKIVQRILEEPAFEVESHTVETEDKVKKVKVDFFRPFDLSKAPLLRVGLIKHEPGEHILVIDIHHIIADGSSLAILMRDFTRLYLEKELPGIKLRYKDYTQWQNRQGKNGPLRQQSEFWQKEFIGEIPVLDLPTDYARPSVQSYEGTALDFEINSEIIAALKTLILETGTTLYMVLLAIFTVFLAKISSQEDIVIGSPVAGRRHTDLRRIIGMFVNTLALRNNPSKEKTFTGFLYEVKEKCLKAFENQDYQYEDLVKQTAVSRDISRNPLFDTMLILQNREFPGIDVPGLELVPYKQEHKTAKFYLTLIGMETGRKLQLTFEYSTKLFKRETIRRWITYFNNLLSAAIEDKYRTIAELEIIPPEEKKQVLYDFNATQTDFPGNKTIHRLFEEQVEKTPDYIAVTGGSRSTGRGPGETVQMTYRELNEKTNQLARVLSAGGVKPGTITGLMPGRSVEIMIGLFAILKAGGAYVPLDPALPGSRLAYILEESRVGILLTGPGKQLQSDFSLVSLEINDIKNFKGDASNLPPKSSPNDLAYVIYTSGSTGVPKGVMIKNRSVVNFIKGITDIIPFTEKDKILSLTTISFDIFGLETLISLTRGSKVLMGNKEEQVNVEVMTSTLAKEKITIFQVTPSRLQLILFEHEYAGVLGNLNYLLVGGEDFPGSLLEKTTEVTGGKVKIYNLYGPTETTIWSTIKDITGEKSINIGKPIANTRVYILGKSARIQPLGVPGELCIAGDGLARGYLNRPELTAEKFNYDLCDLQDYHNETLLQGGPDASRGGFLEKSPPGRRRQKIYKTGDRARWLPDGDIEILDRMDYQVKIRGFRIELGEIERQLLRHEDIKEAVVICKSDQNGDKYLFAYIVSDYELQVPELREYLVKYLPDYMLPSCFLRIEKIPLTPNGKIDRLALPEPEITFVERFVAPRNTVEEKLVELWADVLGRDKGTIGIDANFFELGGHSLKATILTSRIHKELNVKLPLAEMFKTPTIRRLSGHIASTGKSSDVIIKAEEKKEYYPMSYQQKGLYFIQKFNPETISYNMPKVWVLKGDVQKRKIEDTFVELINRHNILRTSFEMINDDPVQKVHDNAPFEVSCYEMDEEEVKIMVRSFVKPFDLSLAPLLRVKLIKISDKKHILFLDLHHIVSDVISNWILMKEFMKLYSNSKKKLSPLNIHYSDYSQWHLQLSLSGELDRQELYWLNRFSGEIPLLKMNTDFPRPEEKDLKGGNVFAKLDVDLTNQVRKILRKSETTLYIFLLAVYTILLSKYSGQDDIVVGSPISGRTHPDLYNAVGLFANMLAMRNFPKENLRFHDFLGEVKTNALSAYDNQDYQFTKLVSKLDIAKDLSHHPLFDVVLAVDNFEPDNIENIDFHVQDYDYKFSDLKFDLLLDAWEEGDFIRFKLNYSVSLFRAATAEKMIQHLVEILEQVCGDDTLMLKDINISHQLISAEPVFLEEESNPFGF